MDDLDAPQWTDFTAASPQVSLDDYFLRRHDKHEYRDKLDLGNFESPNIITNKKMNNSKQPLSESSYVNESILQKTPNSAMHSKGKGSSCKKSKIKQTTYENVLTEAMSNLQLSMKKHEEKSLNKSCILDSPAFKTPTKTRVTRSMCTKIVNSCYEKSVKFNEKEISLNEENKENIEVIITEKPKTYDERDNDTLDDIQPLNEQESAEAKVQEGENENPTTDQSSQINLEVTASSSEHEVSHEKLEPEVVTEPEPEFVKSEVKPELNNSKQLPKSRVVSSFGTSNTHTAGLKKKVATLTGTAWQRHVKRRMSITNQRRLSVAKSQVVTTKFVSMAEAINKYQRVTPQRFHSTNKTTKTEQLRRMSLKLTRAHSPALTCKNRARPVTTMSTEEKEKLELEKIRQNQIKANPVPKEILKKALPLKRIEKKIITKPEPFQLTEIRKAKLAAQQNQETKKIHRHHAKVVPTIVCADEKGVTVKEEEVLHFGIPIDPSGCKKKTKVMPFSFEERNRKLEQKKQERLKKLQEQENEKVKAEFHARPVPAAVKTPCGKIPPKPDSAQKPKITITRSLSFENRVKEAQKKKEEKIKQIQEEEKKARNFKAQKVPEFKPVLVRGRSRDNLLKKSMENLSIKPQTTTQKSTDGSLKKSEHNSLKKSHENFIRKPLIAPPKKTSPSTVSTETKKTQPAVVPKILEPKCKLSQKSVAVLTELNTDKRAKQRKEFEEQIKRKESEEDELRRKEEEDRIARENVQRLELRKMTETKARPMPVFKPMQVLKSKKPLTEAQSPAWAKRKGSTD